MTCEETPTLLLEDMKIIDLKYITEQLEITIKSNAKKNEIIDCINNYLQKENSALEYGTLEIFHDGYGFLRSTSLGRDIYVSSSQIKKFKLRNGDIVYGEIRLLRDDKNDAIKKILKVNNKNSLFAEKRVPFEELIPSYPNQKIKLENSKNNISGRIIDLVAPIGRGQRALVIAPPKAGKTTLLIDIANAIIENEKNCEVWMLLIDERPEEVTDIKLNVPNAKVFSSTFDMDPKNHLKVTEEVIETAKNSVEDGKHIIILMDSLTRLARAYNTVIPSSGKLLSGGIDPSALHETKKFFGTARNIQNSGSLTIIATVLIDTGSKMDEVIFEEFKSTGNCDIQLDRTLSEMRIFPAIDIQRSGTRKEELLMDKNSLEMIWSLRRCIKDLDKVNATHKIIESIKKTNSNSELLELYSKKKREKTV